MYVVMTYRDAINQAGREYLQEVLQQTGGNVKAAAVITGVSRWNLYQIPERHGVPIARRSPHAHRGQWQEMGL